MIEDALQLQSVLADQMQIRLFPIFPDDLPSALVDSTLICRVFQNLVSYVINFTPDGGAVTVSVEVDTTDRSSLRISIGDTGPGISPLKSRSIISEICNGPSEGSGSARHTIDP